MCCLREHVECAQRLDFVAWKSSKIAREGCRVAADVDHAPQMLGFSFEGRGYTRIESSAWWIEYHDVGGQQSRKRVFDSRVDRARRIGQVRGRPSRRVGG